MASVPRRSLQRVLRGLVSNAFHASDSLALVTVQVEVNQEIISFIIIDQGRGMDQETVAKAREPFFSTKPAGQGLGFGLYLAATLAERLDGALEIGSILGGGTTVRFWIKKS